MSLPRLADLAPTEPLTPAIGQNAHAVSDWPMFGMADDVRPALARAVAAGRASVLATLTAVIGGGPRPPGAQMLISDEGLCGFLSGGCIEADIVAHAADVATTGRPQRLIYGDGGPFPDIRLVCGGRVEVLLERLGAGDPAVERLLALGEARQPALWLSDGSARACWAADETPPPGHPLGGLARTLFGDPGARILVDAGGGQVALRYAPLRRMVVVGGDPTAMAIASLAAASGFESWLVRPKGPEAPPPLAGVRYDRRAADVAFAHIGLDPWTYVAVATHDLEADETALIAALPSPAPYVGALGARRRLPERLARLRRRGLAERDVARLRAPIGLDLGGKAPFEIAVAVLAEILALQPRDAPRAGVAL
jgi:xanthine dehydrogenase accessory factor